MCVKFGIDAFKPFLTSSPSGIVTAAKKKCLPGHCCDALFLNTSSIIMLIHCPKFVRPIFLNR